MVQNTLLNISVFPAGMWEKLFDFAAYDTGDWLSFVGLILTLIGFGITFLGVFRAASSAAKAREAVADVREDVRRTNLVATFTAVIAVMDEIKRLHRQDEWDYALLLDRYATIRKALVSVKSANPELSDTQKTSLQNSIQHFSNIEEAVDEARTKNVIPPEVPRLNRIVAEQADNVQEILAEVQAQIGE